MKIEENVRGIMPLIMDKNFSRVEKEKFVKDLVLKFCHIAWDDGYGQANRGWQGKSLTGWYEWEQLMTEPIVKQVVEDENDEDDYVEE
jgi:hypothetical protein